MSGVATEATRAGVSVALSSIRCEDRDVPGEYMTVYRECDCKRNRASQRRNDLCPEQAGLLYSRNRIYSNLMYEALVECHTPGSIMKPDTSTYIPSSMIFAVD